MQHSVSCMRRAFLPGTRYYAACQVDYWYHSTGPQQCGSRGTGGDRGHPVHVGNISDFSNSTEGAVQPAFGSNGTYNEELFTQEAVRLISLHSSGLRDGTIEANTALYMYLAYHNVHSATNDDAPQQAPRATVELYNTTILDTYKVAGAMITKLDEGVGAVYAALRDSGLLPNTVIAFCAE
eukprot:SAG31_NODE_1074_length_10052_cov_88.255400_6_plen_181_part_00